MPRALLLSAIVLASAACAPEPSARIADPVPCTIPGLGQCARSGDVVLSGQPSPETLRYLAAQGYTTVVSTRGVGELAWDERAAVEELGMRFVQIPMANPVLDISDAQIAALDSALAATPGPVLLHCASGNRVAGLWGAWLTEKRGVDEAAAMQLASQAGMRGVRPVIERHLRTHTQP